MDLRYGDVERALVRAFKIQDTDVKAFRARIRHLRNLGVPDLPKSGSGRQISYTLDHARELYLALRLNQLGMMPDAIARLFARIRPSIAKWFKAADEHPGNPVSALVACNNFGGQLGEDETTVFSIAAHQSSKSMTFAEAVERYGTDKRGAPMIILPISAANDAIKAALGIEGGA